MPQKITAAQRLIAIRWLLDTWFTCFSAQEKLKHERPEQWSSSGNRFLRAVYIGAREEEKRLQSLSDEKLIIELSEEIQKLKKIDQEKRIGFAKIDADERARIKHQQRGEKILEGAKAGHEAVHGSELKKKERWSKYQDDVNRLSLEKPNLSYARIRTIVAKKFKVTDKTIQRHTINPKSKDTARHCPE